MNKRELRLSELYRNPDLIIPNNSVKHYQANTWIVRDPQDKIYLLDFSGAVLAPEEDDTAEEVIRLYEREYKIIQNRALVLLTLALDDFRLIGLDQEDILLPEMIEFIEQEMTTNDNRRKSRPISRADYEKFR